MGGGETVVSQVVGCRGSIRLDVFGKTDRWDDLSGSFSEGLKLGEGLGFNAN